ncbi:MAG: hypothetical protein V7K71_25180, partial [Nostoc sp.]|uniref:hypothetical protein n=1 Tax=Nostoc sp. TaxID=1180 RepID=UPI002FF8C0B7
GYYFYPSDFCLLPSALCLPLTEITKSCQEPIKWLTLFEAYLELKVYFMIQITVTLDVRK